MKRLKQVKTRLLLFLISGILLLSIGFIISCGTGPQTKTTVPDKGAYAVDFSVVPTSDDTQPGFINLTKSIDSMEGLREFTIEAWVKKNTSGNLYGAIFSRGITNGDAYDDGILLYISNNQPGFVMALNTIDVGSPRVSSSSLTNDWTHIAVVFVNANHTAVHSSVTCSGAEAQTPHVDIYINGELTTCGSIGGNGTYPTAFNYNEQIGRTSFDFDYSDGQGAQGGNTDLGVQANTKLKAVIDEVRFWKVARTASQIQTWMNKEINETNWNQANPNNALIGYWKFNEGAGTTIIDASGTGNGGVKNYCNSDCAGTGATTILWDGGWVAGKSF